MFRRWEQCLTGGVEGVNRRRGMPRGLGQYDDRGVIPEYAFADNARTDVLDDDDDTRRGTNRDLEMSLAQMAWLNLAALLIDVQRKERRQ